jgi:hypothetical protein
VAPRGQPATRAIDLETIENVIVMVLDGPSSELELRVERSDNDGDLVVRNDSGTRSSCSSSADKVIDEVPLASDERWHFHPE